MKYKKIIGICRLCKQEKDLTFEHIPPRTAFNKDTRYYSILNEEFYKIKNIFNYKHAGEVYQGGIGEYCLCKDCNSFLGQEYVRSYKDWADVGMDINININCLCRPVYAQDKGVEVIDFKVKGVNPLRILKQIISMFICINNADFTNSFPELLNFVLNPESQSLPDKYKIYAYLNSEGNFRKVRFAYTNFGGLVSEIAYPPFGYVLNINNEKPIHYLTEITSFKFHDDNRRNTLMMELPKLPTYYSMPLDFRTKEEIEKLTNERRKEE